MNKKWKQKLKLHSMVLWRKVQPKIKTAVSLSRNVRDLRLHIYCQKYSTLVRNTAIVFSIHMYFALATASKNCCKQLHTTQAAVDGKINKKRENYDKKYDIKEVKERWRR